MTSRYLVDGTKYWLLQRESDQPSFYIHNPNIGAFATFVLALLGAQTIAVPAAFTAGIFAVGLLYGYAFVTRASGSRPLALLFLALLGTNVLFSLMYGLNLLRAWHWLALFGSSYHFVALTRQQTWWRGPHPWLYALFLAVSFGVGYELLAAAIGVSLSLLLLINAPPASPVPKAALALASSALLIALRQVQIIGALGWQVWSTDLIYTAATKNVVLRSLIRVPDETGLREWYVSHGLNRDYTANDAPGLPSLSLLWKNSGWWVQHLGPLTVGAALAGLLLAAWRLASEQSGQKDSMARTVLILSLGEIVVFVIFTRYAITLFYLGTAPLLISAICLNAAFGLLVAIRGQRGCRLALILMLLGAMLAAWLSHHHQLPGVVGDATLGIFAISTLPLLFRKRIPRGAVTVGVVGLILAFSTEWAAYQVVNLRDLQLQPYTSVLPIRGSAA